MRLQVRYFGLMSLSVLLSVRAASATPISMFDISLEPASRNAGVDLSSRSMKLEDARLFAFDDDELKDRDRLLRKSPPVTHPDDRSFVRLGRPESNPEGVRAVPEPSSLLLLGSGLLGLGIFRRKRT